MPCARRPPSGRPHFIRRPPPAAARRLRLSLNDSLSCSPPSSLSLTVNWASRGVGRVAPDDWSSLWAARRRPCTAGRWRGRRRGGRANRQVRARGGKSAPLASARSRRPSRHSCYRSTASAPPCVAPAHAPRTHTHTREHRHYLYPPPLTQPKRSSSMADAPTAEAAPPAADAAPANAPPAGPIDPEKKARQVRDARGGDDGPEGAGRFVRGEAIGRAGRACGRGQACFDRRTPVLNPPAPLPSSHLPP